MLQSNLLQLLLAYIIILSFGTNPMLTLGK